MRRAVMRPVLLRPPDLLRPSVKALTGLPFHSSERSTCTSWRRLGVIGLYCFSAIGSHPLSDARGDVDRVAFSQRHDRLLGVGTPADDALEALGLALLDQRVDGLHLDVEQPF